VIQHPICAVDVGAARCSRIAIPLDWTVSLAIRLLGEPRLVRDGEPVAGPRGNKAWAVLAYLVC
jgi:hypothetical protein